MPSSIGAQPINARFGHGASLAGKRSKLDFITFLIKNLIHQMHGMLSSREQEFQRQRLLEQTVRLIEYMAVGIDLDLWRIGSKGESQICLPSRWIAQNQALVNSLTARVLIPLGYVCEQRALLVPRFTPELKKLTKTLRAISKH